MKIARLLACGFAALLAGSAFAGTSQDTTQPSDESSAQVTTTDQQAAAQPQDQGQAQTQDQAQAQDQTQAQDQSQTQAQADKVNINTADAKTIAHAVKGFGLKRAQAIVAYRKAHGNFKSVDDLVKVKGITASYVKKHHEHLANAFDFS